MEPQGLGCGVMLQHLLRSTYNNIASMEPQGLGCGVNQGILDLVHATGRLQWSHRV